MQSSYSWIYNALIRVLALFTAGATGPSDRDAGNRQATSFVARPGEVSEIGIQSNVTRAGAVFIGAGIMLFFSSYISCEHNAIEYLANT